MADRTSELDRVQAELSRSAEELAVRLLVEGFEQGEDRRRWTIDVKDRRGKVILALTLAEAAAGSGLEHVH